MVVVNGNLVFIGIDLGLLFVGLEILVVLSLDVQVRVIFLDKELMLFFIIFFYLFFYFMKGVIIQLVIGELKWVEDFQIQDFVCSVEVSGGLKIDFSMVVDIQES